MRAAVRKNSSLSELSALRCSLTFHREISPDSPGLSVEMITTVNTFSLARTSAGGERQKMTWLIYNG